jgi:hypothetical protein
MMPTEEVINEGGNAHKRSPPLDDDDDDDDDVVVIGGLVFATFKTPATSQLSALSRCTTVDQPDHDDELGDDVDVDVVDDVDDDHHDDHDDDNGHHDEDGDGDGVDDDDEDDDDDDDDYGNSDDDDGDGNSVEDDNSFDGNVSGDDNENGSLEGLGDSTRRSKAVAQKKKTKKKKRSLSRQAMAVGADETGRCTFGNIAAAITRLRISGSAKGVSRHTLHGAFPHVTHARVNAVLKMAVAARKIIQIKDSFKVRKEHRSTVQVSNTSTLSFLRPIVVCLIRP